jgi:hypothetical protein
MSAVPEPRVLATSYTVSCLPYDDINSDAFNIKVDYAGHGRWAVRLRGSRCLAADGRWDWEPIPSERTDEWLAKYRFDLDTALRLAKEQAPHVTVNRITVQQALERRAKEEGR